MEILNNICLDIVDCEHKTAPIQNEGIPSIRTTDIKNGFLDFKSANKVSEETYKKWTQRLEPQPNDLILAREAPVGQVGIVPKGQRVCLGQRTVLIRPNQQKVYPFYLLYLLLSREIQHKMKVRASGSTVEHLNMSDIRNLQLPELPSLESQKEIGDTLANIDAKIENLRRQNETLEQIAQTIFKHWFIDFEFPNADGKPYKSSGGAMVASAIGDIPEGWKVGKLGDIVEVFMGYPFKSELYSFNSGIKVVRGENVSLGFLRWDTEKRWEYDLDSYTDYFLSVNDYVIGMDGSRVGRNRTIILDSDLPLILAQRVARLRTKDKHTQGYINILLMNNRFEKYVDFIKTGTSIPHISGQQIKDFECIIPLKKQIEKFSGFYNAWSQKISVIRQQIQTLTKTRDSLLPKLMSGQLRVKE
jgi:type I restriction enzyme S subunit